MKMMQKNTISEIIKKISYVTQTTLSVDDTKDIIMKY